MFKKLIKKALDKATDQIIDSGKDLLGFKKPFKVEFGDPSKLISAKEKGFCIDGTRFISVQRSRENYLVVAPSGKGKSQVSVFPFLLNNSGEYSLIVNDPSSELSKTIPYLESVDVDCHILDFGKKTGVYFNPLLGCKGNLTQMRKIAKTLLLATQKESDFFTLSATDTIVMFIQYLTESESSEYQNLANVYRLLLEYQGTPSVVESLMAQRASEDVFRKLKSLSGSSENTRKSIVASALAALSFIGDDPLLCDITSQSTIDFNDFRLKPTALFIHVPIGDVSYYAPMVSIFFQEFYRYAFNKLPDPNHKDIFMILDEFDTLTISDYSETISNSRKFRIPQQIILQSESLLGKYGTDKSKNILNNCGVKCYYGGLGEETFNLEKLLGQSESKDPKTGITKTKPLYTASQIRQMKDEILVIPAGEKPLKVNTTPAFKQKDLVKKLQTPSKKDPQIVDYHVSYINLKD